ncbi:hypothetical protein BH10ACT1_BH10ACT1_06530 [soil metagenome]
MSGTNERGPWTLFRLDGKVAAARTAGPRQLELRTERGQAVALVEVGKVRRSRTLANVVLVQVTQPAWGTLHLFAYAPGEHTTAEVGSVDADAPDDGPGVGTPPAMALVWGAIAGLVWLVKRPAKRAERSAAEAAGAPTPVELRRLRVEAAEAFVSPGRRRR